MSASNSSATYLAEEVEILIVPAGLGAIDVKAKGGPPFCTVARTEPAQFKVTARFAHQVTSRSAERGVKITVVIQGTAPEILLLRALIAAQDASGEPIPCAVTVMDTTGKRVLWTQPAGVLTDYPDDEFGDDDSDMAFGFTGVATQNPLPAG